MERKLNVSRTHRARGIAPAVESGGGWRPGGWQRPKAELGIEQCQKDEQCTTSDDSGSHDLSQLSFSSSSSSRFLANASPHPLYL